MIFNVDKYLSAGFALNLPSPDGTTGDWHRSREPEIFRGAWFGEISLDGEKAGSRNTFPYLGCYGLFEAGALLRAHGYEAPPTCFAANHFRAVLDIIHYSLENGSIPRFEKGLSERHIDDIWQKKEILAMSYVMASAKKSSDLVKWIRRECEYTWEFSEHGAIDFEEIKDMANGRKIDD